MIFRFEHRLNPLCYKLLRITGNNEHEAGKKLTVSASLPEMMRASLGKQIISVNWRKHSGEIILAQGNGKHLSSHIKPLNKVVPVCPTQGDKISSEWTMIVVERGHYQWTSMTRVTSSTCWQLWRYTSSWSRVEMILCWQGKWQRKYLSTTIRHRGCFISQADVTAEMTNVTLARQSNSAKPTLSPWNNYQRHKAWMNHCWRAWKLTSRVNMTMSHWRFATVFTCAVECLTSLSRVNNAPTWCNASAGSCTKFHLTGEYF